MKKLVWFLCMAINIIAIEKPDNEVVEDKHVIILSDEEIRCILEGYDRYVYFGPEFCSIAQDFPYIQNRIASNNTQLPYLNMICDCIAQGKLTAPQDLMQTALYEVAEYLAKNSTAFAPQEIAILLENFDDYFNKLQNGEVEIIPTAIHNNTILRSSKCKSYRCIKTCQLMTNNLNVNNDATVIGNLSVNGNETVVGDLTVLGALSATIEPDFASPLELISPDQQSCIFFENSSLVEKARICSSPIAGDKGVFVSVDNGTTQNLRINNEGGTVIAPPSSGIALSVTGNAGASALTATGDGTTIAPALTLINNPASLPADDLLTIDSSGIVRQSSLAASGFIVNDCQAGPLSIGTSDATSLTLATNGCTPRLTIDSDGAVVILTPTTGEALTVNGNIVLPVANVLATQGILKLGGTGATNINVYASGTRNFFAGNGTINTTVTGTDNVSIGTTANSSLSTANNTIALGNNAQSNANDSVTIGNAASTTAARSIVLGSADSVGGGAAPTASNTNAIAIGSASGTNAGAVASGISAVAIGGADGATFTGASATGDRSIALGVNATANTNATIAVGSASGTAGGTAPVASNIGAIAVGSGHLNRAGAIASGISAVAIGGADGASAITSNFPGAVASGDRSIAIGVNATASSSGAIALGSASGIGSTAAMATNTSAIAIGASSGTIAGASASGNAAIAIGGSSGAVAGASASGDRSVAIGNGASTAQADAIVLGNAAATAVRVGIGITAPVAKLDVMGVNGVPVVRFDQVNTAIGNAPVWLNPSTSASAGTPIHFNGTGQFFGFTSSKRYKTNIRNIEDQSEIIYQLRPVLYDSKEGYGEGKNIPGFIAEEVHEIAPNLAILNDKGQPENVAYNSLHALAIKELQKQQLLIEEQNALIEQQSTTIEALRVTIQQLQEAMDLLEHANAHS